MISGDWKVFSGQNLCNSFVEEENELSDSCLYRDEVVSFYAELPLPLKVAMTNFIERYSN